MPASTPPRTSRPSTERTVRFRLRGANPQFPQYFVFASGNVVDSTEARRHATNDDPWATAWLSQNACGFGQFSVERQTDDVIEYAARDEHWMGRPGVDSIVQVGVDSREEGLRMMDAGDANMVLGLYPEELARFAGRPEFTTRKVRANHSTLEFNWTEAPFDDQKVRQAICYALPYERILSQVYGGHARPSHSPICSTSQLHTPEFDPYGYDVERARALMKEGSHADGFQTELWIKPTYESLRFAHITQQALIPLGIEVDVRLDTQLPFGTKVPMWFKEECGHALYEPMYDVAHDYDPPMGMWGGKNNLDKAWTRASAPSAPPTRPTSPRCTATSSATCWTSRRARTSPRSTPAGSSAPTSTRGRSTRPSSARRPRCGRRTARSCPRGSHGLGVLPRKVVHRREAGTAPPTPPCGRR